MGEEGGGSLLSRAASAVSGRVRARRTPIKAHYGLETRRDLNATRCHLTGPGERWRVKGGHPPTSRPKALDGTKGRRDEPRAATRRPHGGDD